MDVGEKLVELIVEASHECDDFYDLWDMRQCAEEIASFMIANGVTVQECCRKAESVISKTGLMCTACHSDIDRDAVFCKYCGAKVMPQPPKGE